MPIRIHLFSAFLFFALSATACVGGVPDENADEPALVGNGDPESAGSASRETPTGILVVEGEALAAPGRYELQTSCSYSRGNGAFSFGMHPGGNAAVEKGVATFGVRSGWGPRTSIPLEDGTYEAEFEYNEVAGDGTVPTYLGDAGMTLHIVDESRENFPVVEVKASGAGDGIHFQVQGRCQAMVMG